MRHDPAAARMLGRDLTEPVTLAKDLCSIHTSAVAERHPYACMKVADIE